MSVPPISADGHFKIPEGTINILRTSWKKWGVDKKVVKTVTIPDSVSTIGYGAFCNCSSLASIAIPASVTAIGEYAFVDCSSLASITIPDSLTTIREAAFYECRSLASITIPNSVTTIGRYSFNGCSALVSIAIPDSVTTIKDYAFYECTSLTSITIPDSVTTIGRLAFDGCDLLTTVLVQPTGAGAGATQSPPFELNNIHIKRIWAPDRVINQLGGPFEDYATLTDVPRAMWVAPDATTWAGVQLWMYWSDPETDASKKRVLCKSRQQMVWTVMHVAERLEILPDELWLLIFTFVKHE